MGLVILITRIANAIKLMRYSNRLEVIAGIGAKNCHSDNVF